MTPKVLMWLSQLLAAPILISGFMHQSAYALDTVIMDRPQSVLDRRKDYPALLLEEVLRRTQSTYGPYKLELAAVYMERERQLRELKRGELVNVIASYSQPSWEQNLTTIKIPVDMGLQSWRVALINQKDQERLRSIQTLDELKRLPLGVGSGWATLGIYTNNNFNVVPGNNFDGLFEMLRRERFDYFLRGVNEVFPELDARQATNPQLVLDDSFMVHVPLPWLFFVSPNAPRLGKRVAAGMDAMVKDGSLRRFMLVHEKDNLLRAKLCTRRVFEVPNANVSAEFLARKAVWFNPLDPVNGICPAKKKG